MEKTYAHTVRTCNLHREMQQTWFKPQTFVLLNAAPLCHPIHECSIFNEVIPLFILRLQAGTDGHWRVQQHLGLLLHLPLLDETQEE